MPIRTQTTPNEVNRLFITLFQGPIRDRIEIPKVSLDWHKPKYNPTKVALLIENRPEGMLAPHMLHMISVIPPDWKAQFMGSDESLAYINSSRAIQYQVSIGKLDLTYIPKNMSVAGQEQISQFLTTLWIYDTVLHPAENLLLFQTDSMVHCPCEQTVCCQRLIGLQVYCVPKVGKVSTTGWNTIGSALLGTELAATAEMVVCQ